MRRCKIAGLDLVVRGGIRTIAKLEDNRESTLIVVRGATGTGKTLFGAHLAIDAAAARGGDVVVALLEMLPTELRAQLAGIQLFQDSPVQVVSTKIHQLTDDRPCVYASIIEVPREGLPDIGDGLHAALSSARSIGLTPKVLVIDTVSSGYRLGEDVPRELADALSKFAAEQGLIIVVLEETQTVCYSPWVSVADVVLELAHREADDHREEQRTLIVRKSRFNDTSIGPHTFIIRSVGGVEIIPRVSQGSVP